MQGNVRPSPSRQDFLALINPALCLSAAAETLAGALTGGASPASATPYLLALAAALIFAAGSTFSHYFDRAADDAAFPDRPLASGRLAAEAAWRLGWALLILGTLLTGLGGRNSAATGVGVALLVALYASTTKAVWGFGFLTLGAARGLNFVLGLTAAEFGVQRFLLAALPVTLYAIGWAVLRCSRQPGAPATTGFVALLHLAAAVSVLLYQAMGRFVYRVDSLPFLLTFLGLTLPRYATAVMDPRRPATLEAVQYGFLGLTLMEATLAAGYGGIWNGIAVALFCLPLYWALARWPVSLVTRPR